MCLLLCISVWITVQELTTQLYFCLIHLLSIFFLFSTSLSRKFCLQGYHRWPHSLCTAHSGACSHWQPCCGPSCSRVHCGVVPSFSPFPHALCIPIYLILLLCLQNINRVVLNSSSHTSWPPYKIKIYLLCKPMTIFVHFFIVSELCEGRDIQCSSVYHSKNI